MASDADFSAKARKVIAFHDKVERLHAEGRLGDEKYRQNQKRFETYLQKLLDENISSLDYRLSEVEERLSHAGEAGYGSADGGPTESAMQSRKRELESERDMLQLFNGREYLDYLKKQFADAKRDRGFGWNNHGMDMKVMNPRLAPGKAKTEFPHFKPAEEAVEEQREPEPEPAGLFEKFEVPVWAYAVAGAILFFSLIPGILLRSLVLVFMFPVLAAVFLAISTFVLNLTTVMARVEGPSIKKAFTCVAMYSVASIIIGLVFTPVAFVLGFVGLAFVSFILQFGVSLAVPVYCLHKVYGVAWRKAAAVTVINLIIGVILGLIVFIIFGLLGLSLLRLQPLPTAGMPFMMPRTP